MSIDYRKTVVTITLFLLTILTHAQVEITSDTLSIGCVDVYKFKKEKHIFTSLAEFEESEFFTDPDALCLPFGEIDFGNNILVGYKYKGSNCERAIKWSTITENQDNYLIQFSTWPNHVSRDWSTRIAWFVVAKPIRKIDIIFEHIPYDSNRKK
jgi:hypothetical protein